MVSEEEIERAILESIYSSSNSLVSSIVMRRSVIQEVAERFEEVSGNEVEYQLTVLEEDRFVKRDGGTIQMGWQGLERYEELGGNVNLDEEFQEEILEMLLKEKKKDPNHPYIGKDELVQRMGVPEEVLTENVWIQREVGNIELRQAVGSDYIAAAITASGRRAVEERATDEVSGDDGFEAVVEEELKNRLDELGISKEDIEDTSSQSSDSNVEDAFLCHASEDKDEFVDDLAEHLTEMGLDIWYDDFKLEVGDNIRQSIERGLANSRYGIVVLSENFFGKSWPERELDAFAEKEVEGEKVILPVWFDVDKELVREYSYNLSNRQAVKGSSENVPEVAEELYQVIKD